MSKNRYLYMVTTAKDFELETPQAITPFKADALNLIGQNFSEIERRGPEAFCAPISNSEKLQIYIREYQLIENKKNQLNLNYVYLISTATDSIPESPWGIAATVDDAERELKRFFIKLKQVEDGKYINDFSYDPVQIYVRKYEILGGKTVWA